MGRSPSALTARLQPPKLLKFNRFLLPEQYGNALRRQLSPAARIEVRRQLHRSVADPDQAAHLGAHGLEKAPHFAVAPFAQHHAIPAIGAFGRAPRRGFYAIERRRAILQGDPGAQLLQVRLAMNADRIFPFHLVARVHQAIRQLAGIGQQKQAGRIEIEAADGDPSPRRQPGKYRRPAFGIVAGDQLPDRLVVEEDPGG